MPLISGITRPEITYSGPICRKTDPSENVGGDDLEFVTIRIGRESLKQRRVRQPGSVEDSYEIVSPLPSAPADIDSSPPGLELLL
jgi:hypothetical protein